MNWVVTDWRELLAVPWAQMALTAAAVIAGAIIGSERERREKPAGLRTLVLVCLGSAAFTMASYAFGTTTGDTGRVAAQIVTGIGFLGAGVILHGHNTVSGITTAATIWATSAAGIVIGTGHVTAGLALSGLIRGMLTGLYYWEHRYLENLHPKTLALLIDPDHGKTRFRLERLMVDFHVTCPVVEVKGAPAGLERIRLKVCLPERQCAEFLDELSRLEQIKEMRREGD